MAVLHGSLKTHRAGGCRPCFSHLLTLNGEVCTTNSMWPLDWSLAGQTQQRCASGLRLRRRRPAAVNRAQADGHRQKTGRHRRKTGTCLRPARPPRQRNYASGGAGLRLRSAKQSDHADPAHRSAPESPVLRIKAAVTCIN